MTNFNTFIRRCYPFVPLTNSILLKLYCQFWFIANCLAINLLDDEKLELSNLEYAEPPRNQPAGWFVIFKIFSL